MARSISDQLDVGYSSSRTVLVVGFTGRKVESGDSEGCHSPSIKTGWSVIENPFHEPVHSSISEYSTVIRLTVHFCTILSAIGGIVTILNAASIVHHLCLF